MQAEETAPPRQASARYLALLLALLLGLLGTVALINLRVDPFMTHQWDTPAVQRLRPVGEKMAPWGKTYAVHKFRPEVLYVGNSRTHWALPASAHYFPGQRVFNGAIAGASVADAQDMVRHARAVGPLSTVVWGVDYWEFALAPRHPDFIPELVATGDDYGRRRAWLDFKRALSLDMTLASLKTLSGREAAVCHSSLAQQGLRDERCIAQNVADRGGFAKVLFKDIRAVKGTNPKAAATLPAFRDSIDSLCRGGVHVLVYVNPLHAITLENFYQRGFADTLDAWKRDLTQLMADARARGCQAEFYDFSGFGSVTDEPLGEVGPKTRLRYFWEGSHASAATGRLVLARMTGVDAAEVPADFGVRLTPDNLKAHLQQLRADRARYRASHSAELALLEKWFGPYAQEP